MMREKVTPFIEIIFFKNSFKKNISFTGNLSMADAISK